MTEYTIFEYINKWFDTDFILADDEYSSYDGEEQRYIGEIKVRNKFYNEQLIEYEKLMHNVYEAKYRNKDFLYIVVVNPNIYVFNITKLLKDGYDFKWSYREMPKNSHFGGKDDRVLKQVGYIKTSVGTTIHDNARELEKADD